MKDASRPEVGARRKSAHRTDFPVRSTQSFDRDRAQVRRAICWNDHTLAAYHARGLERLGGPERVRDLIGSSDGFRRPGSIISIDPGIMYAYRRTTLSVNGPWAVYRNRPPSVPEIQNHITNGDAFFADYTVIVSLSHHF